MRVFQRITATVLLLSISALAFGQASENASEAPEGSFIPPVEGAPIWGGPSGNVLHDNGPLVNSPGTGAGGADESVLQTTSLGMNTIGFGHQIVSDNRMADDFTVPAGQSWSIDEIVFFAYQTGSTTTSTITDYRVRIWDGVPQDAGSSIVFGDLTTNRLASTAFAEIYRVTETAMGLTNRPIMASTVTIGTTLPEGTYYLDWFADGSIASGPWAPSITIDGTATTGNGLQSLAGADYLPALDTGTDTPQQGLPFIIVGDLPGGLPETQAVPALGFTGLLAMILVLVAGGLVVLRRY